MKSIKELASSESGVRRSVCIEGILRVVEFIRSLGSCEEFLYALRDQSTPE